jgi:quercetin dioxygenase-like cupin family protein
MGRHPWRHHHSEELTFGHITLEKGAVLPEHHHVQEQWTHVIEGQLEFSMQGETVVLTSE